VDPLLSAATALVTFLLALDKIVAIIDGWKNRKKTQQGQEIDLLNKQGQATEGALEREARMAERLETLTKDHTQLMKDHYDLQKIVSATEYEVGFFFRLYPIRVRKFSVKVHKPDNSEKTEPLDFDVLAE
jgi:hypothetical protein